MRFEMYVRDAELGKIFENLFGFFHKYLVIVKCTQTHVVLSIAQSFCTSVERKDWGKETDGPLRISTR